MEYSWWDRRCVAFVICAQIVLVCPFPVADGLLDRFVYALRLRELMAESASGRDDGDDRDPSAAGQLVVTS